MKITRGGGWGGSLSNRTTITTGRTQATQFVRIARQDLVVLSRVRLLLYVLIIVFGHLAVGGTLLLSIGETLLKVQQLTHEGKVGRNVGFAPLHVVVGVVKTHFLAAHQVGHCDCNRPTDPSQAMDQHTLLLVSGFVYTEKENKGGGGGMRCQASVKGKESCKIIKENSQKNCSQRIVISIS